MNTATDRTSCAIVVTFEPDITALLKLLGQLNRETDFLVIDNGSSNMDSLQESITVYERCIELVKLPANEGLARALNRGIELAAERDYEFVFLFDQDSSLCDLFVHSMIESYRKATELSSKPVAVMGPRIINPLTMRQTPFKLFNRLFLRSDRLFAGNKRYFIADFLITSGSLLKLEHLKKIGLMKESYFIDNVDMEWCFRAKSMGYELLGTDDAVLYHLIGELSQNPLVKAGIIAKHSPSRTYYSSRNRRHLWGMPYSPLGWKLRDIVRFSLKASWLIVASTERREYWQNIRAGLRDSKTLG